MNEATWKKHCLVEGDNSCKNHPGRIAHSIKVVTEKDVPDNFWTDANDAANSTFSLDGIPYDGAKNGEDVAADSTNAGGGDARNEKVTGGKTTKKRKLARDHQPMLLWRLLNNQRQRRTILVIMRKSSS